MSSVGLESYLYGRTLENPRLLDGQLTADERRLESHVVGRKVVPSGFFAQPDTEHVSAVLFSNSGTVAKFTRMGFPRHGAGASFRFIRTGVMFNPHQEARHASLFLYDLRKPHFAESWLDGLVVMHNPNAVRPLPASVFRGATQVWGPNRQREQPDDSVYRSTTVVLPDAAPVEPIVVGAIGREEGRRLVSPQLPETVREDFWFSDPGRRLLGVVTQDAEDAPGWRAWHLLPHGGSFSPHSSRLFRHQQEAVDYLQEKLALVLFRRERPEEDGAELPLLFPAVALQALEELKKRKK